MVGEEKNVKILKCNEFENKIKMEMKELKKGLKNKFYRLIYVHKNNRADRRS